MFSVFREGCHVGFSREFVGTVYCTYGQLNTTNVCKCYGIFTIVVSSGIRTLVQFLDSSLAFLKC